MTHKFEERYLPRKQRGQRKTESISKKCKKRNKNKRKQRKKDEVIR